MTDLSFTKFSRICRNHVKSEKSKHCFCNFEKNKPAPCNSYECPRKNRREDVWKSTDA